MSTERAGEQCRVEKREREKEGESGTICELSEHGEARRAVCHAEGGKKGGNEKSERRSEVTWRAATDRNAPQRHRSVDRTSVRDFPTSHADSTKQTERQDKEKVTLCTI